MKRNILLLICLMVTLMISAQGTKSINQELSASFPQPKVDIRVELISVVFRLAGNREYNAEEFKSYTQDIHYYFDKYKEHPVIAFATKLRIERGVSYDAVMKMAIHIGPAPAFTPKVEFSDEIPEKRWGKENALKFLELLRDFYVVSDFEKFYTNHAGLYSVTEERFLPVYNALNIDWYNQYYGTKPEGSFNVIICPASGGSNYGGKVVFADKKEDSYAIMGTWTIDANNKPVYKIENYLPTLIHEFNHSYVNHLVDKYSKELEKSGQVIYEPLKENMKRQAYSNWKTMISESLVRVSVIRYLLKYDSYKVARSQMISEIGNGFYWMKDLVELMHDYENDRVKYPSLESFMPLFVDFYNKTAKESETMYEFRH